MLVIIKVFFVVLSRDVITYSTKHHREVTIRNDRIKLSLRFKIYRLYE